MANLNIGIILGSTRQGRLSPQVGEWVKSIADKREMPIMKSSILQILTCHLLEQRISEPELQNGMKKLAI